MALRRRERPLSPEELRDKIFKDYSESWLHSDAHFGFDPSGSIFSLSPAFEKGIVMLFILDAADYVTDRTFEFLQYLKQRYPRLAWIPIIAFDYRYSFLKAQKFYDRFKTHPTYHHTPLFLDQLSNLGRLYKFDGQPSVVFFSRGHDINRMPLGPSLDTALMDCEKVLQVALRTYDRGLALPLVQPYTPKGPVDSLRIKPANITMEGNWADAEGGKVTDDPKATISTMIDGRYLRLVCTLHSQARDSCKLFVTLNDKPVPLTMCGVNLKADDRGHTVVEIHRNGGLYEILQSTTLANKGTIKIQFVSVVENPVVFYELRVAN